MTPQSIVHWFDPPEFTRVDLTDRARALWIISWPFFLVVSVLLGFAAIMDPDTLVRRATTVAAVSVLTIALHATSRAGRPVLASWILVTGLSVIVTQRAWVTGGVHTPVSGFYFIFVIMAGALLGFRGAVTTAAACSLGAMLLTIGNALAWIAPRPGAGSTFGAFVVVLLTICLALVLYALVARRPDATEERRGRG